MTTEPRDNPEVNEALRLLSHFEAQTPGRAPSRDFYEAILILDDYLDTNPPNSHRQFIANVRMSYIGSLSRPNGRMSYGEKCFAER